MLTVIKLQLPGTDVAGDIRAKCLAAQRSATPIAILAEAGIALSLVGVLVIVMAIYFGLAPVVGEYQAALIFAATSIFGAAICAMDALIRRRLLKKSDA